MNKELLDFFLNSNSDYFHSNQEFFYQEFKTLDEAIKKMKELKLGEIKELKLSKSKQVVWVNVEEIIEKPKPLDILKFRSETGKAIYNYTIKNYGDHVILRIYETRKHKMITAAIRGDLKLLKENFQNTDKMKGFALSTAIIHNRWNIVEYLTDNYDLKNKAMWNAIRYNKVGIMKKLLDKGYKLPADWLAYCMYSNSYNVMKELIIERKVHLSFKDSDLKTRWFYREIKEKSPTVELVKKTLGFEK